MTVRKATLYIGGGTLLGAWLASAASLSLVRHPVAHAVPSPPAEGGVDGVAHQVQQQARRLKQRLSSPPTPPQPLRNPFTFRARGASPEVQPVRGTAVFASTPQPPLPAAPVEPRLELVGVAESRGESGTVRTAMIATDTNDLIMAVRGASVAGRYTVGTVDAESVDLVDLATGATRRLVLQRQ